MLPIRLPLALLCAFALAAPGFAAPARDARGFVVSSNPAVAPPQFNGAAKGEPPKVVPSTTLITPPGEVVTTGGPSWSCCGPPPPPPPPQGRAGVVPPPCTRIVTDGCVQSYERRSAASRQDLRQGD
jgi:hypothetical protein